MKQEYNDKQEKDLGELTQIYNKVNDQEKENRKKQKEEEEYLRNQHEKMEKHEITFRRAFINNPPLIQEQQDQQQENNKKKEPSDIHLNNAIGPSYESIRKIDQKVDKLYQMTNQRLSRKFDEATKYTNDEVQEIIKRLQNAENKIEELNKLLETDFYIEAFKFILFSITGFYAIRASIPYAIEVIEVIEGYFTKKQVGYVHTQTNNLSGDVANAIHNFYIQMGVKWNESIEHAKAHLKEAFYGPEKHNDKTNYESYHESKDDHHDKVISHDNDDF